MEMNFRKIWIICRVCLRQQEEMYNLFDDTIHNNIWAMLRDCSGVPIRKNDSLPDKICETCLKRLWEAMNFRNDCQRSHRDLFQKQMEWNSIELLKTSNIPSPNIVAQEEQQISTYITSKEDEGKGNVLAEPNNDNDLNIKQYCVVAKNANETNPGCDNETQSQQPIVLLLRLKNVPSESSQTETIDLTNLQSDKSKTNDKLSNKEVKAKTKIPAVMTPKLNKRKTKFSCNVCKKMYKTNELLRHHSYVHKKPHECPICHKTFSQRQTFVSHINHHTGNRPYYCRICRKTFSDVTNRNSHEKRSHLNEQQFKCNGCNKSFRFLSLLQKHSSSHKSKKCFICNKEFTTVRMVRMHHQRLHLKLFDL